MVTLPERMRALVKARPKRGLDLADVPVPSVGDREVLIRVDQVGICGTDVHIYEWDSWAQARVRPGTIIGHEFMGTVVRVGAVVADTHPGDRVTAEGHIGCGHCRACRTGRGDICSHVQVLGVDVNGAFADYVKVPESNVWRLHPAIPADIAAVHDPLGNAVHTVMTGNVAAKSVLVMGAGAIGLMMVACARMAGALEIVVVEPHAGKRELARRLGANAAFDSAEPFLEERLRAGTRGETGYDVLLEASGNPDGIRLGFKLLGGGGTAALLGIPRQPIDLDLVNNVIFKGVTVRGVYGRRMFDTWYQMEDFLVDGGLDISPVITHRLSLELFSEAFDLLRQGEAIKVILDLTHNRKGVQ